MRTALLVPGSASSGDFVQRAFSPLLSSDDAVVTIGAGGGDAAVLTAGLASEYRRAVQRGDRVTAVIGVSVGAHAAAEWAAAGSGLEERPPVLVLALPAWTGPPDETAELTAGAVAAIRQHGVPEELARLRRQFGDDWVVDELVAAWAAKPEAELLAALTATARSEAPTTDRLRMITAPTVVVAHDADPFHPATVARTWAETIPGAVLAKVGRDEPAADRSVFGRRVLQALAEGTGAV